MARAWRRGEGRPRDLAWVVTRSLPFAAVLLLAYLLALTGLAPSPEFPYDPGRFELGWRAAIVLVILAISFVAAWIVIRPLTVPRRAGREGLAAAAGVVLCGCVVVVLADQPLPGAVLRSDRPRLARGDRPRGPGAPRRHRRRDRRRRDPAAGPDRGSRRAARRRGRDPVAPAAEGHRRADLVSRGRRRVSDRGRARRARRRGAGSGGGGRSARGSRLEGRGDEPRRIPG